MQAAAVLLCCVATAMAQTSSSTYPEGSNQWTLVFRHFANVNGQIRYWPRGQWRVNPGDSSNRMYSIMDALEQFRLADGGFVFKLVWPDICTRYGSQCPRRNGQPVNWITWRQTSDPYRSAQQTVTGYQTIDRPTQFTNSYADFLGLSRDAPNHGLMDGQPTHGNWYYSVGTYIPWSGNGNFPACPGFQGVSQVEIYVWGEPQFSVNSPMWRLMFRQNAAASSFPGWTAGAANNNTDVTTPQGSSPGSADLYSGLSQLQALGDAHSAAGIDTFTFKLVYPGMCIVAGTTCDGGRDFVIWTQSWNPLTTSNPTNPSVRVLNAGPYTGAAQNAAPVFGGLQMSTSGAAIDPRYTPSGPGTGAYTVGVQNAPSVCRGCLPGPMNGATTLYSPAVELYVFPQVLMPSCDLTQNFYRVITLSNGTLSGQCTQLTSCQLGVTYQSSAPTAFSDRVCSNVSECWTTATDMAGSFVRVPATLQDDVECAPLTPPCNTFAAPHYESGAPTPTTDRQCAVQPVCVPPNTYEVVAPTATTSRVCLPTTSCGDDLIEQTAPTPTTDRVCAGCPVGQYVVNGQCTSAAQCPVGAQFQTVQAMGDDNTVCAAVSSCDPSWQFQLAAATATTDAVCVANTNCSGLMATASGSSPCQARCTPCSSGQAMMPPSQAGGCPSCVTLTPPSVGVSTPPAIFSDGTQLTLRASAVNANGVDLLSWIQTLQDQLQATQSAAIAQAQAADQVRVRLEDQIARLNSRVAVLEATTAALVDEHRSGH